MVRKKEEIVITESPYVVHSKEHAMKLSVVEGSVQSAASNSSVSFMTPFALAIGSNSFHIGLLSSLVSLVGPLGQWKGSKLMEKYSRKKILMNVKLFQTLLWILVIGLAYLFWKGLLVPYLPYLLIAIWAVIMQFIFGMGHVSWFSWMGDLVPAKIRGKYFAERNKITGFVGLVVFLGAAFILDVFKTKGYVLLGFSVLFGVAMVLRLVSRYLIGKQFNPQFRVKKGYYFGFGSFVKNYDNYGKFAFYQAVFYFSVMISAPFFAVYMLEDLGFSYFTFTAVSVSSLVFFLVFSPLAGKFSDKYGNVKLLIVSAVLFPFVPVLWIFFKHPLSLIFIPGLISGIANAAFVLGSNNFTYDAVSPQKRGLCLAYTGLLIGIGTAVGSLLGGFLIQYVPISFMKPIFFTFSLSTLLMVMASLFFLPQIKEETRKEELKGFSVDVHHPFKAIHSDIVWFKNFIHGK